MELLNIKEDSWLAWLYQWILGGKELTPSMCNWFWVVIFAPIVVPLNIPILIYYLIFDRDTLKNRPYEYIDEGLGAGVISMMMSLVYATIVGITMLVYEFVIDWQSTLIMLGWGALIISGYGLLIYGIITLMDYFVERAGAKLQAKIDAGFIPPKKEEEKLKEPSKLKVLIKAGWEAYLGKYCPKINWIKNDSK